MNASVIRTLVVVIVVNAILAGSWWYLYSRVVRASGEAVRLAEAISVAEAKQDNIRTLTVFFSDIEEDRAKISSAFVDRETLVLFIENMERLAAQAAVILVIESASLPEKGAALPSFRVRATGSFAGLYRFAALLETMPYHVVLDEVRFSAGAERQWTTIIQFQLASFTP